MTVFGNQAALILSSRHYLIICFSIYVIIRLVFIFFVDISQTSDALWYHGKAIGIALGDGYLEQGIPTAFWPAGYPMMLGVLYKIFGSNAVVGKLSNLLFSVGTFWVLYYLAKTVTSNLFIARLSVLLLALYPNNVAYSVVLLTETFFTFLLLSALALSYKTKNIFSWVASGIFFGFAALTKAQILVFPVFLFCWLFFLSILDREKSAKNFMSDNLVKFLVIHLLMFLIMAPWTWRNYVELGSFVVVSTNGGVNLLIGNNDNANGGYLNVWSIIEDSSQYSFDDRVEKQVQIDKLSKSLATSWIFDNLDKFVGLIPVKIYRLWIKDGEAEWFITPGWEKSKKYSNLIMLVKYFNQLYYMAILVLSVAGLIVAIRHSPSIDIGYIIAVPVFVTIIASVFFGGPRFHFTAIHLIIVIASLFFGGHYTGLESRS